MEWSPRQSAIVDAALKLIAERGIQNLTVKNLAAAIGVTEPAIYRHFRSKSEIVKALIASFDDAVICDETADGGGFGVVMNFIRGRFEQVRRRPELARVMFAEELFMDDSEASQRLMEMMHRHRARLERCFAEAERRGEIRSDIAPDMLFRIIFGAVRLLVKQWGMTGGAFDLETRGEELIASFRKLFEIDEPSAPAAR